MTANKRTVHLVVQLFIYFCEFVHSVSRSLVFADERSVDRLIVDSVIRLSVRSLGYPLVRSFALRVCSVVPPFAQFFLLFMGINML